MPASQASISGDFRSRLKGAAAEPRGETPLWSRIQLAGRLCELFLHFPGPTLLTAAFRLVLDAQMEGEPVAWIAATPDTFFPPDAADNGVDLNALVVVRVPGAQAAARSADRLLRSGGLRPDRDGSELQSHHFHPAAGTPGPNRRAPTTPPFSA